MAEMTPPMSSAAVADKVSVTDTFWSRVGLIQGWARPDVMVGSLTVRSWLVTASCAPMSTSCFVDTESTADCKGSVLIG